MAQTSRWNRRKVPLLIALGVVIIAAGAGSLVSLWPAGPTAPAHGPDMTLQTLAATAVPTDLPAGAPAPPPSHATVYCGSSAAEDLAVDKARQARLLAQTFYIPKSHTAETPTTSADIADLQADLTDAIGKVFAGNAATFAADEYSAALKPEQGASATSATTGGTPTRDVSGGVSDWKCDSVSRNGSVMTVKATGVSWAIAAEIGSGGAIIGYAEPMGPEHLTYTFGCNDAGVPLRITSFKSDFTA